MFGADWDDAINNKPFATSGGIDMLGDGSFPNVSSASAMEEARKVSMNERLDSIERGLEEMANKIDILMALSGKPDILKIPLKELDGSDDKIKIASPTWNSNRVT